jgi:ATP-dependent RNA helicase DeaD
MLDRMAADGSMRAKGVRGLVLVPTRELAMQASGALQKYATSVGLTVVPMYGGAAMDQQIRTLRRGADIVVATPGRALDHLRRSTMTLEALSILVLDEADEMLDMGFAEDLEAILALTPATRQTALFSATMPARIAAIAHRHLKNPRRVTVGREKVAAGTLPRVRQVACLVPRSQKPTALARLLELERPKSALVFCRTRHDVEVLAETLNASGHRTLALHGGMEQRQRDRVMQGFRAGQADLLVATDVAARGLDIDHLSHVINYDIPPAPEAYLHRIGRTGRIGRDGVAITLADPRDQRLLRTIEAFTKQKIAIVAVPTLSDLHARRLDLARASLRERVLSGGFDEMRIIVDAMTEEFDARDLAAAAMAMGHERETKPAAASARTPHHESPDRRPPMDALKQSSAAVDVAFTGSMGGGRHEGHGRSDRPSRADRHDRIKRPFAPRAELIATRAVARHTWRVPPATVRPS